MSDPIRDDLFRPTIGRDLDDLGAARPALPPNALFLVTFFGGAAGGGILWTLNFVRLGMRRQAWICGLGFGALWLAILMVLVAVHGGDAAEGASWSGDPTIDRVTYRLATLLAAFVAWRFQRTRIRLVQMRPGSGTVSVWGWALGAIGFGVMADLLVLSILLGAS